MKFPSRPNTWGNRALGTASDTEPVFPVAGGLPGGGAVYTGPLSVNSFDTLIMPGTALKHCCPGEVPYKPCVIFKFSRSPIN